MRTTTLICALLLLTSCNEKKPEVQKSSGQAPAAVKFPPPGNDDSSPIVVADGSTHVKHGKKNRDHFQRQGPKSYLITAPHYRPDAVGYLCDASFDAPAIDSAAIPKMPACPTSPPCPTSPTSPCMVDLKSAQSWTLFLCEKAGSCSTPGTVNLAWNDAGATSPDSENIPILSNPTNGKDFAHHGASSSAGADLEHPSSDSMQNATLVVTPHSGKAKTYKFSCASTVPGYPNCLTIGYDCHVSGSDKCGIR